MSSTNQHNIRSSCLNPPNFLRLYVQDHQTGNFTNNTSFCNKDSSLKQWGPAYVFDKIIWTQREVDFIAAILSSSQTDQTTQRCN